MPECTLLGQIVYPCDTIGSTNNSAMRETSHSDVTHTLGRSPNQLPALSSMSRLQVFQPAAVAYRVFVSFN